MATDLKSDRHEEATPRRGAVSRGLDRIQVAAGRLSETLDQERSRLFLWLPVLLGTGIALYFSLGTEPGLGLALALPVLVFAGWLASGRWPYAVRVALAGLLAVASGFALAKMRTEWVRAPILERSLWSVEVRGVVELVEPRPGRGQRITLRVTALDDVPPEKRPHRVRVRTLQVLEGLRPGEAIRLKARLSPPASPSLPGDYDFGRRAWYAGLGAVGYSLAKPTRDENVVPEKHGLEWRAHVERLRQQIGVRITAALPGETGAIANALITGERGAISDETNNVYRDSGLLHMLSISGLHMAIMAGAVFLFVRSLLAAVPSIALRYPIKKWGAATAIVAAFGYLLISGWSVPTVRSWLMCTIMLLAVLLDRPALSLRNVALSALAILVVMPESLGDAGFQMSYAAVVSLVAAYEGARGRLNLDPARGPGVTHSLTLFFWGIVVSTLVASAAVAPFAAYHFHKSQQFAVLANLIAIPLCNLIVMPAALMTLLAMPFGWEAGPLKVMGWGIEAISATAGHVAALPGAVGFIPAIPTLAFLLMVGGGLWLALWRTRLRLLGIGAIALGLALSPFQTRPDLLAGRDGALVALRNGDGVLAFPSGRPAKFEAKRWLEYDGDARSVKEATKATGWTCDGVGCMGKLGKLKVAVVRHPAALADDCTRADILILPMPKPAWCNSTGTVIDFFAMRKRGTHAIYLEGPHQVRVQSVNDWRGARPWVQEWTPYRNEKRERKDRAKAGRP